ncbi:MAG: TolC family protein [Dissulfurispiraceae bacterium]|jgi:TolC family type I secretion outer membrane protein|nr:TolC family protein [Dissulfurispiraceae bacterium]
MNRTAGYYMVIFISILTSIFMSNFVFAEENRSSASLISAAEVISLEQAINIALRSNPQIAAAISSTEVNRSKIGQASSAYYPQIDLSAGANRFSPENSNSKRNSEYASSASIRQNIYDFGKTAAQVNIQELFFESSSMDLVNTAHQITANVKLAYFSVLQAEKNRDLALDIVNQYKEHLDIAVKMFEVGLKPKFDVTKAEVDLSNAKLNLIKTENSLRLNRINLKTAMGQPDAPEFKIIDILGFEKYELTLAEAVNAALTNRPDLQSLFIKQKAAEKNIDLAKKGYYPSVTGSATYTKTGDNLSPDNSWNIGAAITFPLFSGFMTKHQIEEARASLKLAKANEDALKQNILLEVQQAMLNLNEAEERISAAELTVKQADENLEIAKGRYNAGVGSPIEVTDALTTYSNAKTAHTAALYDYKIAQANLEKAMGVK